PLAKVAERAQNGPSALHIPSAPSESASSDTEGDVTLPLTNSPAAPTKAGPARCQRRSWRRSECAPTITIPIAAARYGTIDTTPTAKSPSPPKLWMIWGIQKLTRSEERRVGKGSEIEACAE